VFIYHLYNVIDKQRLRIRLTFWYQFLERGSPHKLHVISEVTCHAMWIGYLSLRSTTVAGSSVNQISWNRIIVCCVYETESTRLFTFYTLHVPDVNTVLATNRRNCLATINGL